MNTFSQFHLDSLDRSTYILQGFFLRVFYLYSLNNLYNFIILALSALNHIDFKHLVGQASKHCFNFPCLKKHMLNLLLIFLDLLSKIIFFEFLFIVKLTPSMPALVRNYWKKTRWALNGFLTNHNHVHSLISKYQLNLYITLSAKIWCLLPFDFW